MWNIEKMFWFIMSLSDSFIVTGHLKYLKTKIILSEQYSDTIFPAHTFLKLQETHASSASFCQNIQNILNFLYLLFKTSFFENYSIKQCLMPLLLSMK